MKDLLHIRYILDWTPTQTSMPGASLFIRTFPVKALYIVALSLFTIFTGCKDKKSDRLAQAVAEWQGKEVYFPEEITSSMFSTEENKNIFSNSQYKIVVYVDSIGCMSCKLKLNEWNSFLDYINKKTSYKIATIFIFNSLDYQEI